MSTPPPASTVQQASAQGSNHASTKEDILRYLLRQGQANAQELAQSLEISPQAVRRHLKDLETEDLIVHQSVQAGMGRPQHLYQLSKVGRSRFPEAYDDFALSLLDTLAETVPPEQFGSILRKQWQRKAAAYREQMGNGPLPERLTRLVQLRQAEGYLTEWCLATEVSKSTESTQVDHPEKGQDDRISTPPSQANAIPTDIAQTDIAQTDIVQTDIAQQTEVIFPDVIQVEGIQMSSIPETIPTQAIQTATNQTARSSIAANQANSNQANSNQANSNQANSNQANSNQANSNQANPNQANPNQANLNQAAPIQTPESQLAGNQLAGNQLAENQLAENQFAGSQTDRASQISQREHYVITEYSCAIASVAESFPTVCDYELELFSATLPDCRVQRTHWQMDGEHRCGYLIEAMN